jgi:tRNA threonylcarbamoyladenosine modification (KEOPS) complex  Pcc1 subunit
LQAKILLEYHDEKMAEAIAEAISPENFKAPSGLKINTVRDKNFVVTQVEHLGNLATFIATIDDLLFSASTAEKTVKTIREK